MQGVEAAFHRLVQVVAMMGLAVLFSGCTSCQETVVVAKPDRPELLMIESQEGVLWAP